MNAASPRGGTELMLKAAQRAIFYVQRELESAADAGNPAIVLCDRGTIDGGAYCPAGTTSNRRRTFWGKALGILLAPFHHRRGKTVTPLKSLVLLATVLAASFATAEAKSATGIYLTTEDYKNGRLASESDCDSPGHKVELHDILHKSFIHVTHGGETRRYEKNQIYGFRSCGGQDYRFVDNDEYQILESREVSIYAHEVPARNPKDTSRGLPMSRVHFFSAGAGGQVLPLTLQNLKRAFPINHLFHDALDATFHTDDELAQFDTFHKMFKVNRLLVASTDR